MFSNKIIAAVLPCYNEEQQITNVVKTIPDFVDKVIAIDDCSKDNTVSVLTDLAQQSDRLVIIQHNKNQGVGGAIASGYKWARDNGVDIAVVMAGDGQMDPDELPKLIEPVALGEVDYTKTNRLLYGDAYNQIPRVRYFGNSLLSMFTKIASGYWHIADSQSGYTAIGKAPLHTIDWDKMYKRYGQPNDLLVKLNIFNFRVRDIVSHPVYNVGEKSKMKVRKVVFTISWLLVKRFFYRLKEKYVIRDFHPLVFFYFCGFLLQLLSIPLLVRFVYYWIAYDHIPKVNFLAWMFAVIMGVQFILFAMWFDMDSNKHLR